MAGREIGAVTVTETVWIPLADGTRLAARLWLPEGADPVPAILEYIPYRRRDGTRGRDEPMHGFFASQGYAALRVDMRGSGDSDGLLADEYLAQEQDDALEVIAWIGAQSWCSGAVGMMGKSWGGFNCLQVAARRPPALKAIVTVCSTDDRFADDIHYMGGCLLNDNLWWGTIMLAYQARPPDPAVVGEGWRAAWLERLDAMPFWPKLWLDHQRRDAYWRHGSVCEDWGAIQCPVLVVGGWGDAYTGAVPRLLEHLTAPRRGLIGPWAHIYPHDGVPGPAIDFLGEAVRWWDAWLKGHDTGVMQDAALRAFVEDWQLPSTTMTEARGRFVGEASWPSPTIRDRVWNLGRGVLADAIPDPEPQAIRSPQWTGAAAGEWMGTGVAGERPADQRGDDGFSLCFDTGPLPEAMDVLGAPVADLHLAADRPQAQVALRLCDVAPDGSSLRVSYAVLNLSHRDGSGEPRPLVPGEIVAIKVPLKACGHRFPAGHRVRLAISTAYWPLVWPAPEAATVTVARGTLSLPERPARPDEADIAFPPPRHGPHAPQTKLREGSVERQTSLDLISDTAVTVTRGEGGLFGEGVVRWDETGTAQSHDLTRTLTINGADPSSAKAEITQRYAMGREGWAIVIESVTGLSADAEAFHITGTLRVSENGTPVHARSWDERVPRDNL